jgi:hypothetical protein
MRRAVIAVVPSLPLAVVAWGTIGSVGAQARGCLPTRDRTLGPYAFPGLRIKQRARAKRDARRFLRSMNPKKGHKPTKRDVHALKGEGFVSGIIQRFFSKRPGTKGDGGVSAALQLGSPRQARAHLHRDLATVLEEDHWKRFKVAAIPGSRGLSTKIDRGSASNVFFTDGDYFYFVGRFVKRGGTAEKQATNAAIKLYKRVHGAAACP